MDGDDAALDAALATRTVAGDPDAEAELCGRLFPRARAYGLLHLRDESAAADLAQQVLVVVIEALRAGRVREIERVGAFVAGVCRNTLLDLHKSERRRDALLAKFGPSMAAVVEQPGSDVDRVKLEHCLDHLSVRDRMIVALTFFADRSADDISKALAMTAGNVRVSRHRALRQLHGCISGEHS